MVITIMIFLKGGYRILHTLVLGPSTGWLYASGTLNIDLQRAIFKDAGATCVEAVMSSWHEDARYVSLSGSSNFSDLEYRSLHLPAIRADIPTDGIIRTARLVRQHAAMTAVVHPVLLNGEYPLAEYERLIAAGIPLAIENMDKDQTSGRRINELMQIADELNLGFVLDLQHAFEQDKTMAYARELYWSMCGRIRCYHVSGQNGGNNHTLLCQSENAHWILNFLAQVWALNPLPIIIEGEYADEDDLRKEIAFLRQELAIA